MNALLRFTSLLFLGLLGTAAATAAASRPANLPPPNLVFLLADDMGAGDTSAYQSWSHNSDAVQLHTPAMDRLAKMGVRYLDAHAPSSRCSPTRYALLTGRYCWRTRLKHWVLFGVQCDPLIERARLTLPEFLQQAGYRTGMVGKWHLGLSYRKADGTPASGWDDADLTQPLADGPLDHGFDSFHGMSRSHGSAGPDGTTRNSPTQKIGPGWIHDRRVTGATGNGKALDGSYRYHEVGDVIDREALAFLRTAAGETRPFFLYFASPANHSPYTPSAKLGDTPIAGASRYVNGQPTGSTRLDFIYQNDVHLARLMDFLAQTPDPRRPGHPLSENTLVVFSSDNGADKPDKSFTGPVRSYKGSVYEGGHRIPFLASWPLGGIGDGDAATPGRDSTRLIALTDMFATMAEILGRPLPPLRGAAYGAEDSVSQLAALRGESCPPRIPVFSNDHFEASKELSDERAWVGVRSDTAPLPGQWKVLLDHHYAWRQQINPKELYNLAEDPMEARNLINEPAARPALDHLVEQARLAAGDNGTTRQLQPAQ